MCSGILLDIISMGPPSTDSCVYLSRKGLHKKMGVYLKVNHQIDRKMAAIMDLNFR